VIETPVISMPVIKVPVSKVPWLAKAQRSTFRR
jgi:hypothetical protein